MVGGAIADGAQAFRERAGGGELAAQHVGLDGGIEETPVAGGLEAGLEGFECRGPVAPGLVVTALTLGDAAGEDAGLGKLGEHEVIGAGFT